ncbi:RraA family protein [Acaryochloris sp. CCMEE 5410]|uniref:RraA family protein n=1 Tax=Acaryochloris sp. CCMEE 5410 TaxID=310037 RepID=UPI0002483A7C|nr:RraA family protein [Acaryochloris sp. CCMEE 5410]KAI9133656.1 RraA family protein [Acaryochloris sp. CCMEE 5410]
MTNYSKFRALSPTVYADALGRKQFMDIGIKELWPQIPRIAGPAYTVRCPPGDNLMLHAAIYRAPAGSVIVVEAGNVDYAVSGGNVCAIAQRRQIAGFVVDGVIRDIAEVRAAQFPVFARGVSPIPGIKQTLGTLGKPIYCGGVHVHPQDIIVADEEGIAVIPAADQAAVYEIAYQRTVKDASLSLEEWEAAHKAKIARILLEQGFTE